jgi:hypothetical protein
MVIIQHFEYCQRPPVIGKQPRTQGLAFFSAAASHPVGPRMPLRVKTAAISFTEPAILGKEREALG